MTVASLQITPLFEVSGRLEHVVFQEGTPSTFLAAEAQTWHVFAVNAYSASGTTVSLLKSVAAVAGARPLVLSAVELVMQLDSGRLQTVSLSALPITRAPQNESPADDGARHVGCAAELLQLNGGLNVKANRVNVR